ncbi:MAG: hypothetical protein ACI4W1_00085 [Ruminococcus sp.]
MKRKKICKYLCLLFVAVCSVLFTTTLTAVAVQTDGSMEVIAHIETAPVQTTQPVTDNGSSAEQDVNSISTGGAISVCVVISLLLLIISVLVIYFCRKNDRSNSIHGRK